MRSNTWNVELRSLIGQWPGFDWPSSHIVAEPNRTSFRVGPSINASLGGCLWHILVCFSLEGICAPHSSVCPFEQSAIAFELLIGLSSQQAIDLKLFCSRESFFVLVRSEQLDTPLFVIWRRRQPRDIDKACTGGNLSDSLGAGLDWRHS
jgi:hypothetical protein